MTLRNLLEKQMAKNRYRPSDLAKILGRSRAVVSITLSRKLENCKIGTIQKYMKAVGLKFDFNKILN